MEFHGMPWTLYYFHGISVEFYGIQVECHGIPWNAMDVILFPWHFSGIPWHFSGIPWNSIGYRRLVLLIKLVSGSKQWKSMEFGQQSGGQQKIQEIF